MKAGLIVDHNEEAILKTCDLLGKAFPEIRIQSCSSYANALRRVSTDHFNIMLIDIDLPNNNGLHLISHTRQRFPDTYVVVTTIHDDEYHLLNSFKAGAHGYLLKDTSEAIYLDKLHGIARGDPPLSPSITRKILRFISSPECETNNHHTEHKLSPRETEVLTFIAKGYNRKEIAKILKLSPNTIARYTQDIYHRLNISNKSEATIEACRLGLVNPSNLH